MTAKTVTTATAKEIAKRWVESQRILNELVRCHVDNIFAQLEALTVVKLSSEEIEQLFTWVRERADEIHDPNEDWKMTAAKIGGELALPDPGPIVGSGMLRNAIDLCKAARWSSVIDDALTKNHTGLQTHRLKTNPMERKFSKAWEAQLSGSSRHLDYLLDVSGTRSPEPASDRDHAVAATVIQWLGSPVGQSFLANALGHEGLDQLKKLT